MTEVWKWPNISYLLKTPISRFTYFAHPYSPWERGTNENTNELIRQYFPKGTDFNTVPVEEIKAVQQQLNGRPRKILDWESPADVFQNEILNKSG